MSVVSQDSLTSKPSEDGDRPNGAPDEESQTAPAPTTPGRLEPVASHTSGVDAQGRTSGARQRRKTTTTESPVVRAFSRVGTILHSAHAQDFERRRRPELGQAIGKDIGEEDDDEDEDATTDSEAEEVGAAVEERRRQKDGLDGVQDPIMDFDDIRNLIGPPGARTSGNDEGEGGVSAGGNASGARRDQD